MANLNELEKINIQEYFIIKREVSQCHSLYQALYNLAEIKFSDTVSTAAVSFDKQGNFLNMIINPTFWNSHNINGKKFIILHELSHVIYDHGKRALALDLDLTLSNIAQDIFINHHLDNHFNIQRETFDWKKYCWVETCFPNEKDVPTNRSFEYYYQKLLKQPQPPDNFPSLLGNHSDPSEDKNENNSGKGSAPSEDIEEDLSDDNSILEDILENNPDILPSLEKFEKEFGHIDKKNPINFTPPSGTESDFSETKKIEFEEPSNYDKFIKTLLPPKKPPPQSGIHDTWVGSSRRYASFLEDNPNLHLPTAREFRKGREKEDKKNIWIFIDVSGSCHWMLNTFSSIVKDLTEHPKINCRAFGFGDTCKEIDTDRLEYISFSHGNNGGFDCIERRIIQTINTEDISYPDNVVVLSDGYVSFVHPENVKNPKAWVMLISTASNIKESTPPGGKGIHFNENTFQKKKNKNKF